MGREGAWLTQLATRCDWIWVDPVVCASTIDIVELSPCGDSSRALLICERPGFPGGNLGMSLVSHKLPPHLLLFGVLRTSPGTIRRRCNRRRCNRWRPCKCIAACGCSRCRCCAWFVSRRRSTDIFAFLVPTDKFWWVFAPVLASLRHEAIRCWSHMPCHSTQHSTDCILLACAMTAFTSLRQLA